MTNELPRGVVRPDEFELVRELTEEEQGRSCSVRHEDAGGQCMRPTVESVYGLTFCEVHGPEVRIAALSEAAHEAEMFFERFRNCHVPRQSAAIERGLTLALDDFTKANRPGFAGKDYDQALLRAYGEEAPEKLRAQVHEWELGESPGQSPVLDVLLDMLTTVAKLTRIAFEEREVWLVEMLEQERESVAAQAAVALETRLQKRAERRLAQG